MNQNLLAVYTDYEGDYTKPFTYMIGCEVSNLSTIPEGMRGIESRALFIRRLHGKRGISPIDDAGVAIDLDLNCKTVVHDRF